MATTRWLRRGAALEDVTLEPHTGTNVEGGPTYGTAVTVQGNVRRGVEVEFTRDGQEEVLDMRLMVAGDEDAVPAEQTRVTTANGETYTVRKVDRIKTNHSGELDHVTAWCREEE